MALFLPLLAASEAIKRLPKSILHVYPFSPLGVEHGKYTENISCLVKSYATLQVYPKNSMLEKQEYTMNIDYDRRN
ncbi:hypothetical protein KDA_71780 [Dictyobacter alpinus]|uniref:Uncharacterized protein n=2 Tax=Dictyobacter alpinus TaxID=2014873 RepID=A0A402BK28_9CHLR|nr:hypothetical protein KDA_71780 [Dictyobacter alpinus]